MGCAAPNSMPLSQIGSRARPEGPMIALAHDAAAARHVLNRFAFGPRPGESEAVAAAGIELWLEAQLGSEPRPNPELESALLPYRGAALEPRELVESWLGRGTLDAPWKGPEINRRIRPHFREHLAELGLLQLTRHVLSERQLEEVMVEFWINHFNVFAPKGLVRALVGDYIEHALRPRALGRFEDLLVATARHPAMLIYLDNAASSSDMSTPGDGASMRRARSKVNPRRKAGGLNENYARELLELHTLGRDGGYTQDDVIGVARILTGWGVSRRARAGEQPLGFVFRQRRHDTGAKQVLGERFPEGHAEDEGMRLLALLARHPATAKHLARKLCAHFVADDPPSGCLLATEHAFVASGGELRVVLGALVKDETFWATAARGAKLKTPLEFAVSALRAVGAKPDGSTDLARVVRRLGEPLFEESVPVGYLDSSSAWLAESGMLARMQFATSLSLRALPGVSVDPAAMLPPGETSDLLQLGNRRILGQTASAGTLDAIQAGLASLTEEADRPALASAWFLGSPEFQQQ